MKDHNALVSLFRPRKAIAPGDHNIIVYHGETATHGTGVPEGSDVDPGEPKVPELGPICAGL